MVYRVSLFIFDTVVHIFVQWMYFPFVWGTDTGHPIQQLPYFTEVFISPILMLLNNAKDFPLTFRTDVIQYQRTIIKFNECTVWCVGVARCFYVPIQR